MLFGTLVAIQLALVASEPTVLLQTFGDNQLDEGLNLEGMSKRDALYATFHHDKMRVNWEGAAASSMESALASYVREVAQDGDASPALVNLLKTMTKKNDNGDEYVELKPLVTLIMDTVRAFMKTSTEAMTPKLIEVVDHVFVKGPEMAATQCLKLVNDLFIEKNENAEVMDIAIAVRVKLAADALGDILAKALPMFMMYAGNADSIFNMAQLAATTFGSSAHVAKLQNFHQQFDAMREKVEANTVDMQSHLRMLSQSSLKDGASRERALAKKQEAVSHIEDKLEDWATRMHGMVEYYFDNMNVLAQTVTDQMPASPMKAAAKKYLFAHTVAFRQHAFHGIDAIKAGLETEAEKHSKTLL